ncbi:LOW QUALITY PROTEIN: putative germin-like protein 2-3 [Pyrus x bretschneideri]|uniref:LOW QUALITY PROTEIN: putative germin-like protein 2-3 n=1 Tax=Pyrus x bretschneideri TaxID=225117 RepID=UPI00202EBB3A|nr:LOW QUALITY PROTEIN: putative germin-like protein 2-3 [Pyrus x bretschneideri]
MLLAKPTQSQMIARNRDGDARSWKGLAIDSRVLGDAIARVNGLNPLGISAARIDFAPWGLNPPHTHPRATENLTVLEGSLKVGFVTSNQPKTASSSPVGLVHFQQGDVFVFPVGLVHFQQNVGHGNAVALVVLSSQNPGVITIANAVFGSNPDIRADILARAFQLGTNAIYSLQSKFLNKFQFATSD